jgi:hypothetical protein
MRDLSTLTQDELRALIRERRARLDAQIASGERPAPRAVTYIKKGPPISGPHGWAPSQAP